MLRLTLPLIACLAGRTSVASAQVDAHVHSLALPRTALGSYVPELHSTVLTLAVVIADTPNQDRDIATAAWQALALSGMGSNMRYGHHKTELKKLIVWLTRQQTALTDNINAPRLDRADGVLMALAFTRIGVESEYKLLNRFIEGSIKSWLPKFAERDARPPTTEETALLALLAQSLKQANQPRLLQQVLALAKRGAAATPTTTATTTGQTLRLHAAARHCVELAAGAQYPPELTLAQCWPDDALAAPLHAWLGAFQVRTLPASVRTAHWQRVQPLIAKRQASHLWPKSGKRDAMTTSAMMLAVIGMCHGNKTDRNDSSAAKAADPPRDHKDPRKQSKRQRL
tara:strand:+ start:919 stop:1944 length:1026 start_codon:yes stop_codon:yes gene_type:complete